MKIKVQDFDFMWLQQIGKRMVTVNALVLPGLLEHVTVLIGVAVGKRAVAGVIHQPYYNYKAGGEQIGRTIWGIQDLGVGGFTPVQVSAPWFTVGLLVFNDALF
jgi:hypothetical protein